MTNSPPPYCQTLISSRLNLHIGNADLSDTDITPACPIPWRIYLRRLYGGRQEGVFMLVVNNGHQLVRLIPTRGMGILDVQSKSLRLGWDSPVQEVIHPDTINLESRGGTGWLEGFNEYLVRCGLEWCGPPAGGRPPVPYSGRAPSWKAASSSGSAGTPSGSNHLA